MDTAKHPNQPTQLPRMSTPRYEPKVGEEITVELPDERTRARIERLISDTHCIAVLLRFPVSKSHNYRKGDLIPCRHEVLNLNQKGWRAVSQRELDEAEAEYRKQEADRAAAEKSAKRKKRKKR